MHQEAYHRPLFSWHSLEPFVRLNNEMNIRVFQLFRECMEMFFRQHYTEVWNRYFVPIDRVEIINLSVLRPYIVADNLMAE